MLKFKINHIAFILLGTIYLLLPTQNANIDSWYYAACVKHNAELWNSHHLLYNSFARLWYLVIQFFYPRIEAITALNIMNSLAALGCLYVLKACLIKLNTEIQTAFWLSLLCGVSFGFMRFATDAETYILPLLFSLIATYYFIHIENWKQLLLASLFSCLAILFHQLHIWWGLTFVIFLLLQKPFNLKNILLFSSLFLIATLVYFIVYKLTFINCNFLQFITGEYSKGNATIIFSFHNLLFSFINLFRSFIQIHGYIIKMPIIYFLIFIVLIYCLYNVFCKLKPWKQIDKKEKNIHPLLFSIAFIFHLLFAMLSSANAEFMVMLPFLAILYLATKFVFSDIKWLKAIVVSIFIWNIGFGLIPQYFLNINKVDKQVEITLKNPQAYFLWQNKPLVENMITYQKGFKYHPNFINNKATNAQKVFDSLLNKKVIVYRDVLASTEYSRERFFSSESHIGGRYYYTPILKYQTIYGENTINIISKKGD